MRRTAIVLLGSLLVSATVHAGGSTPVEQQVQTCFACHGKQGASTQAQYPILAGQSFLYIYNQLKDFKAGRRSDPQMSPMAANLSKEDMQAIAMYFSKQPWPYNSFNSDPAKAARAKAVADAALCTMCHLGQFQGQNEIPRLAGQHFAYLKKQLLAFRSKTRTNDAGNMTAYTASLTDQQIDDLANYLAGLTVGH